MVMSCNSSLQEKAESKKMPKVVYNSETIEVEPKLIEDFIQEIDLLLKNCDYFYELIVTDKVINENKNDKQYLEIIYPEKQKVETARFKALVFDRLLIPLSGKFQTDKQLTFFSGYGDFSNTPLINSEGKVMLDEALKKLLKK